MSEKLTPRHTAYTAKELVDCGWVSRVRSAVLANGNAVRIGPLTIEAQNINRPDVWMPIMLPNGGTKLASLDNCTAVIDMITGFSVIPPSPLRPV